MSTTTARIFAENTACRPAHHGPYTVASSYEGRVDLSLHLGTADIRADRFETFAVVKMETPWTADHGAQVAIFVDGTEPDSLEAAVALRDALNVAIRHARKVPR